MSVAPDAVPLVLTAYLGEDDHLEVTVNLTPGPTLGAEASRVVEAFAGMVDLYLGAAL